MSSQVSMNIQTKSTLFSGIQPSGLLTIGGYIGALRNWVRLQHEYDCLFCIVDLHAITVRQDPKTFAERCLSFAAQYIALGIDPKTATIFLQSHVPAHTELTWLLNCHAYMGELSRMTQFKDKTQGKKEQTIGVGLFDYPVLMAADILLYQTKLVPVGADQKQHLELTRDLAVRMNHYYGQIFTVPEAFIPEVGARVMSLQEPTKKMSKSDENEGNYIALIETPDVIRKKIKRAVTDATMGITYEPDTRPGVANLLTILGALTDRAPTALAEQYADKGNAALKGDVADALIAFLEPFQARYHELMDNRDALYAILRRGAEQTRHRAEPTLRRVYGAMGFWQG
ncbi:MAG: Tryptophan--tRNA ligase [bacterium ADurb.Bin429]|nr:MAG: Tryptophan--tRNA ligase [bacterium ADurb.Bin429]